LIISNFTPNKIIMKHQHFILHKPYGYLSQFIYEKKRPKKCLGDLYDFPQGTMAIGRLDEKSEGLLLLTTDGMRSEIVRSKQVEKEYYVKVDGIITPEAIALLKSGVTIGIKGTKYLTKPCEAYPIDDPEFPLYGQKIRSDRHGPSSWMSITLTEGKFRQIRKMTAAVGFPTLRLIRVRIGEIKLQNKNPGACMPMENLSV
jgi:23S rRNA pseudouridine2457 synthase